MYWTDGEGVKRARLDGSGVELLTKEHARGFIALDVAASRMYWADWPTGTIKTAPMSREPTLNLISNQQSPFAVTIDPAAGKVYWLQLNLHRTKAERETIRRANLDGSGVQTLIERPGAGFEGGLAIDPGAGKLYWSEAEAHDVAVANLDGSNVRTLFGTGLDGPVGLATEASDPHPLNTHAPRIEGSAAVGNAVGCDPGVWAGTGPITFAYQWSIAGAAASEWATSATYLPAGEQAGQLLACAVSATDDIATSSAGSAAVTVAPVPAASPLGAAARAPLIAGIALTRLTSSGARASAGLHEPRRLDGAHGGPDPLARRGTTAKARGPEGAPASHPRDERAARRGPRHDHAAQARPRQHLPPRADVHSADGQTARDAATLSVRAR